MRRSIAGLTALLVVALMALAAVAVWSDVTTYFQQEIAPALARFLVVGVLVALACVLLFFLWHFLADPTRRLAERSRDAFDYRVERARVAAEIQRRIDAIAEEQRVRALAASARVHESAGRALAEGRLRLELEELKGRSEEVVMRAQAAGIARMLARYQAAQFRLENSPHMTAAEKTQVLSEIRALLADEAGGATAQPIPEAPPRTVPASMLEYRAPGGEPVEVTPDGLRRLLERGGLGPDDECRRVGVTEWASVDEILRSEPQD